MIRSYAALLLAAGQGSRLRPYTDHWPKCLMPIHNRPLLEYWLEAVRSVGMTDVLVNLGYLAPLVRSFLERPSLNTWVKSVYEPELQGTAGTLRANASFFAKATTTLLVHADNWCQCDFQAFLDYHRYHRPDHCAITMMTFTTETPQTCGIVETDSNGVVTAFYEKVADPPGNVANGAVYLLEPEVLNWLTANPQINDFSTQVLPCYTGRIATWHNARCHRDIGTIAALQAAQGDPQPDTTRDGCLLVEQDDWYRMFAQHPIHRQLQQNDP